MTEHRVGEEVFLDNFCFSKHRIELGGSFFTASTFF